ncbi:CASP-like protein 4A2 [Hibiscus trionum]|uniref:CASP-like protein n=1 Tax=Hibiscus trionum TaxID=183268 RepID=A0A9W7MJA7_HIBTR|nr:CASP-like protein 4A2 [Hibiscus trionum]
METKAAMKRNQNPNDIMKRSSSSNSDTLTHYESPNSPFRLHSPLRSDQGDPDNTSNYASPEAFPVKPPFDDSKALVAMDKSTANSSPFLSPPPPPSTPPQHSLHLTVNRAVREEGPGAMTRTKVSGGAGGGGGAGTVAAVLKRSKVHHKVIMAALGFRLSEIVMCLISFSVMAADKTQGWSGDSYDRYKEYRYCLSVNVIGFVYAGFQAYDVAHYLITETHVIHHHFFLPFAFFMDQILAYLLISAASAAASRVDDWQSNWGKDEFTEMATASIAMAFLAFIAFAFSSIISGYQLWTHESL